MGQWPHVLRRRPLLVVATQVGRYAGSSLIALLGGISRPAYHNIETFMFVKSAFRLLPLMTVPFLVPKGTPADTAEAMGAGGALATPNNSLHGGGEAARELGIEIRAADTSIQRA